jgi:hypothetical protein
MEKELEFNRAVRIYDDTYISGVSGKRIIGTRNRLQAMWFKENDVKGFQDYLAKLGYSSEVLELDLISDVVSDYMNGLLSVEDFRKLHRTTEISCETKRW